MRNFQDIFETRKRLFNSAFSICMTVLLIFMKNKSNEQKNVRNEIKKRLAN